VQGLHTLKLKLDFNNKKECDMKKEKCGIKRKNEFYALGYLKLDKKSLGHKRETQVEKYINHNF